MQGNEIPVDIFAYTNGENMRPRPFKARFIARSQRRLELLLNEADLAEERLQRFSGETKVRLEDYF